MARQTTLFTVEEDNRDAGKTFLITEMAAAQAESWAMRALLALMAGDVDLPRIDPALGMVGMAEVGIKALAKLNWEVAEPLLDEMWTCIEFVPDAKKPHVKRPLIDSDIEEVKTRLRLRLEVLKLHLDFLKAVAP